MGGEHWSVKVYDSGGIVFQAWPTGRPELKACVSEATRYMRRTPGVFIVVRVDWRWVNGKVVSFPDPIEHVLQAAGP